MRKSENNIFLEAINERHSVRRYKQIPLTREQIDTLCGKISEINSSGDLHFQLVTNEPKAFKGIFAYGSFSGVENYIIIAGGKSGELEVKAGYHGEELVLLAQALGLNTCWAGLSYRKIPGTYSLEEDEKILAYIALGFGETQGADHKRKTVYRVSNYSEGMPQWFLAGVEAALLAPTAVNQQKFRFEFLGVDPVSGKGIIKAHSGFSIFGYTRMDLGIAKLHFELGAGIDNFLWK